MPIKNGPRVQQRPTPRKVGGGAAPEIREDDAGTRGAGATAQLAELKSQRIVDKVERGEHHVGTATSRVDAEPAPTPVTAAHGGVLSLRMGETQVKRLWNRVQGLLNVGDPGSLNRAAGIVGETRALEKKLSALPDDALPAKIAEMKAGFQSHMQAATAELASELEAKQAQLAKMERSFEPGLSSFRTEVQNLERALRREELKVMDLHMPEAFALASDASARALGMRPYDEQLQAGALLAQGKVVEQYTGEGKTLSAVAPTVLAAMAGRGVHVATSSNYLARRDAELMAPAYNALGLSVSALLPDGSAVRFDPPGGEATPCDRKSAYEADVTYATATQLGFDHLRDNLVKDPEQRVQRGNPTLIMDEVDSLLIDDARTPLIISGKPGEAYADERVGVSMVVEQLKLGDDIEFDRTTNSANLTDEGFDKLAGLLGLEDPMQLQTEPIANFVDNALRARCLFTNGIDYIVKDDKIELIGKNGEILPGRRLSNGLHQAIEARERVTVNPESRTIGAITLRDYLGLYDRVGGMTGTAEVSEQLFEDVYGLDVVRVPTHKPLQRVDRPPRLYATIEDKALAALEMAVDAAAAGRPVLLGCPDERTVAALSALFEERGIPHNCLTAQNEAEEAEVIADAGRAGSITLSTPKGGRGVDFKLGGADAAPEEKQAVVDAGGLLVIGFAHNDSARIDNQLRGRAGRQGEPGETVFLASLEDRFFAQRELPRWVLERPPGPEGLESRQVTRLIESYSALGESMMQGQLKDSLPYEGVNGAHRLRWLNQRESVLRGDVIDGVFGIVEESLFHLIDKQVEAGGGDGNILHRGVSDEGLWELYKGLAMVVPLPRRDGAPPEWKGKSKAQLKEHIVLQLHEALEGHLESLGPAVRSTLRTVLLDTLDEGYSDHIEELDGIRASIGWQQMAQKDPKLMYQQFADDAWREFMQATQDVIARAVLGSMPPVELE